MLCNLGGIAMNQIVSVDQKDRDTVQTELSQCQARVLQTLVPTILALGVIAIAQSQNIKDVTLGCTFATLFSSSLYVASLSYKIYRNASFLRTFVATDIEENKIRWEEIISEYRQKHRPFPFHSETTTAGSIYVVLALTFLFIFYRIDLIAASVGTVLLLLVAFSIFTIYAKRGSYQETWEEIKKSRERAQPKG